MRVTVTIMLKDGVLDPQGEAVHNALLGLGFAGIKKVTQGKVIELELSDDVGPKRIDEMCKKLLVNEVIEDYKVEIS